MAAEPRLNVTVPCSVEDDNLINQALDNALQINNGSIWAIYLNIHRTKFPSKMDNLHNKLKVELGKKNEILYYS